MNEEKNKKSVKENLTKLESEFDSGVVKTWVKKYGESQANELLEILYKSQHYLAGARNGIFEMRSTGLLSFTIQDCLDGIWEQLDLGKAQLRSFQRHLKLANREDSGTVGNPDYDNDDPNSKRYL